MKKVAAIAVLCTAFLFALWGCSDESPTAPAPAGDTSGVTAPVSDGGYFTSDTVTLEGLKSAPAGEAAVVGPDVAVTSFTATPSTLQPGDDLALSATVANLGGSSAVGPFDVWMGVLNTNFEFARVTLPALAAGQVVSGGVNFTVPMKRLAKAYPPGVYTLYCVAAFPDTNRSNNYRLVDVTLEASPVVADLAVSKSVDNGTPNEGDTVNYTVTVANHGPDAASGVEITDNLPAGVTFQSATPSQGTYAGGIWTVGALADSAVATLSIAATVDSGTAGQTITNSASVTAMNESDPDSTNDAGSAAIVVQALPVGTVVINPEPNAINAPWTLDGPAGQLTGNGDVTLFDQLTGSYTITWGAVAGYDTPAGETLNLNEGQVITFAGTYVMQTSEAIGLWFDTGATQTCTTATFGGQVQAYVIYSDPSVTEVTGFEAGMQLSRASGSTFTTLITRTFPVSSIDVGLNDGIAGTYNIIVGFGEPYPTTANTVLATLNIFFLEMESTHITLGPSDPESPPITGNPAVVDGGFNTVDVAVGQATIDILTGGETCAKSASGASSWDKVRSLYR